MYSVLCTLSPRPLAWIQFEMDARSLFNRSSISTVLLLLKHIAVSSANSLILQLFTHSGRSLVYTRNNKGPRQEPCGTPGSYWVRGGESSRYEARGKPVEFSTSYSRGLQLLD